mmetsp:Transcript_3049/g.10897  ORF Transcript_3049/g.10897 Transcript_3049/m.10897 type:complete len:308 (+) Transcript_3049:170-1093(+)
MVFCKRASTPFAEPQHSDSRDIKSQISSTKSLIFVASLWISSSKSSHIQIVGVSSRKPSFLSASSRYVFLSKLFLSTFIKSKSTRLSELPLVTFAFINFILGVKYSLHSFGCTSKIAVPLGQSRILSVLVSKPRKEMFTICRAMPMVSEPGGSRFRINVNILLRTSASKANDVAKSDDEEETFLLSSSSLSSSSVWFPVDQLDASTKVLAYSSNLVITFSPSFSSSSDFFLINERIARCTTSSSSKLLLLLLLLLIIIIIMLIISRRARKTKTKMKSSPLFLNTASKRELKYRKDSTLVRTCLENSR